MTIQSFKDENARAIANGLMPGKGFPASIVRQAQRTLLRLAAANRLEDLRTPSGMGLHALKGDRQGQHAVKVNAQYRVCFRWTPAGPEDVEITDYH